jgi:large subunit ribosomal protein L3e
MCRFKSKKKAFSKASLKHSDGKGTVDKDIALIAKYATTVRALVHTQVRKVKGLNQKKAHIMEIQVRNMHLLKNLCWKHNFCHSLTTRRTAEWLHVRCRSEIALKITESLTSRRSR